MKAVHHAASQQNLTSYGYSIRISNLTWKNDNKKQVLWTTLQQT